MSILIVGIDVGQATLDVACGTKSVPQAFLGTFANAPSGWEQLTQRLAEQAQQRSCDQLHLVLEPTGGYEWPFLCFAETQGWQISLPNPKQVRDWAKGVGYRGKSDRQDALLLTHYGREHPLTCWHPLPAHVADLRDLLERREDVAKMLREERNRQHATQAQGRYRGLVQKSLEDTLLRLETSLTEIEEAIQQHLQQYSDLRKQRRLLEQVPGIGRKNSLRILVLLHRWQSLTEGQGTGKALTAYLGLDPQPHESGTSVRHKPRISRQGNRALRAQLYLGALGGNRSKNSVLRRFYDRLCQAGKPKMVALLAGARKILVWAWAVFRSGKPFDPALACPRTG